MKKLLFLVLLFANIYATAKADGPYISFTMIPAETPTISIAQCRQLHEEANMDDDGMCITSDGLRVATQNWEGYQRCIAAIFTHQFSYTNSMCSSPEKVEALDQTEEVLCLQLSLNSYQGISSDIVQRICRGKLSRFIRANRNGCLAAYRSKVADDLQRASEFCRPRHGNIGIFSKSFEACSTSIQRYLPGSNLNERYCGRVFSGVNDFSDDGFRTCMRERSEATSQEISGLSRIEQINKIRRVQTECHNGSESNVTFMPTVVLEILRRNPTSNAAAIEMLEGSNSSQ